MEQEPRNKYQAADALSCLETTKEDTTPRDDDWQLLLIAMVDMTNDKKAKFIMQEESQMQSRREVPWVMKCIAHLENMPPPSARPKTSPTHGVKSVDSERKEHTDSKNTNIVGVPARTQNNDWKFYAATQTGGYPDFQYHQDREDLMKRKAPLMVLQKSATSLFMSQIIYLFRYPQLVSHSGERQMYDTMRHQLHWHHMANELHKTIEECRSYA